MNRDNSHIQRGRQGEDLALAFLLQQGMKLIERNAHSRHGEIDLIMRDRQALVFVEVRYRKGSSFGSAMESIDNKKIMRIIKTAQYWLQKHPQDCPIRFDAIGISSRQSVEWIKDAFQVPNG